MLMQIQHTLLSIYWATGFACLDLAGMSNVLVSNVMASNVMASYGLLPKTR